MQKVYESSTAPEAHMIRILLESRGIYSRIDGEHLQSGAGTLQAIGIIRVMVEDSDYIVASEIIDAWESDQSAKSAEYMPKAKSKGLVGFLVGATIASSVAYWIYSSPVTVDGIDYNGDGLLDEKWEYRGNRISKAKYDRNFDGVVDQIYSYSPSGTIKSGETDYNFDGTFETRQYFHKGNIILEESDQNQNGIVEYQILLRFGQIESIEFIDEESRKIKKRQFYETGRLISAEFDSNGDGSMDIIYKYDVYEEIKEKYDE